MENKNDPDCPRWRHIGLLQSLVAHACAGRGGYAHPSVSAHGIGRNSQSLTQQLHQRRAPKHAVRDVVAEQHAVLAHRLHVKEAVKTGNAFHLAKRQVQTICNQLKRWTSKPLLLFLDFTQHLHQSMRSMVVAQKNGVNSVYWMAHSC